MKICNYFTSAVGRTVSLSIARSAPRRRWRLLILLVVGGSLATACGANSLHSPDGRIQLTVDLAKENGASLLKYEVAVEESPVLDASAISFVTASGKTIGEQLRLKSEPKFASRDSTWQPVYGERSSIRDNYNQLCLHLVDEASGHGVRVEFRCYDAGVAFRTTLQAPDVASRVHVAEERTEFRFTGNHDAWRTTDAQGKYYKVALSKIGSNVERPLVVEVDENTYAAVAEACLVEYAPMTLSRHREDARCLEIQLGSDVMSKGQLTTPWRVIMLGDSPGDLLEKNDIVLNLNDPCAITDTSWIKPGKVLREFTLTTAGAKACIDFAARSNFQYIEFDAGWYGHEYDDASDATTVTLDPRRSSGPLDIHETIEYAKQRDIGVIVYVNRRALEKQLDELLPLYKKWGIAGVKYGFVKTGTQEWTAWLHEAVRKAAEHELMVDIHDEYRPTGYSRTYPNLMTQEGVRGDEATPTSSQAIATLFTRNLAGAADHTICYFDQRVADQWTHGHQLAKAVCTYSPWQFVYWYDSPLSVDVEGPSLKNRIVDTPELEFFAKVPTVWDDTRVVHGKIGEFAVVARRSGRDWFVGALNAGKRRELDVPLDFLSQGVKYKAKLYKDDPNVNTVTRVRIDEDIVSSEKALRIALLPNGGQAVLLTPADSLNVAVQPRHPEAKTTAQ